MTSPAFPIPTRALVSHSDGARGFYVATLTDPDLSAAFPSGGIIDCMKTAITASPVPNAKLLAMNVAMSTAMEMTHKVICPISSPSLQFPA